MIPSKKRLPSPTKQTPCPAISVIAHNLAIVKAIQKVSFETIDRMTGQSKAIYPPLQQLR